MEVMEIKLLNSCFVARHTGDLLREVACPVFDPYLFLPSFLPSIFLSDVLCDPTDLIGRKGTPFETMTGRTAPSSDSYDHMRRPTFYLYYYPIRIRVKCSQHNDFSAFSGIVYRN